MTTPDFRRQPVNFISRELDVDLDDNPIGKAFTMTPNEKFALAEDGAAQYLFGVCLKVEFRGSGAEDDTIEWARILKKGRVISVAYSGLIPSALSGEAITVNAAKGGKLVVPGAGGKWFELDDPAAATVGTLTVVQHNIGRAVLALSSTDAADKRFRMLLR